MRVPDLISRLLIGFLTLAVHGKRMDTRANTYAGQALPSVHDD